MTNSRRPSNSRRSYHVTLVAFITFTMVISALVAFEPTSAWPFRSGEAPIAVQKVTLTQDSANQNEVTGTVHVQSRGVGVAGARVYVTLTYPEGRSVSLDAQTSRGGQATFTQPADGDGEYTLAVTDVKRQHYRYNVLLNEMTSASTTIGESGPSGEEPAPETDPAPESDPVVGAESTTGECAVPGGADQWHEPASHEHGDAPPAWADEFSCAQFGHPVVFGGDEQTPNENALKHHAFVGFTGSSNGYNVYLRLHAQSNPMGRSVPYHSYEAYVLDPSGNVSMIQGWLDYGVFPNDRGERGPNGDPNNRPAIFGATEQTPSEQWYSRPGGNAGHPEGSATANELTGAFNSGWYPDTSLAFFDATTYFSLDEAAYVHDMGQWPLTGGMGTHRSAGFHWYAGRISNELKGTEFYATQFGQVVSGPDDPLCSGTTTAYGKTYQNTCLPQTIADTVTGNVSISPQHKIDCPDCVMPN